MEMKLKFRDFNKIIIIDNTNPLRAFLQMENYIKECQSLTRYQLYWMDKENEFINFKDFDGFSIALTLNKDKIIIYVCTLDDLDVQEHCDKCKIQLINYFYHCLGCDKLILCNVCIKLHQSESRHFAIFEKSNIYNVHPYLYKQMNGLLQKDTIEKSIANICTFFQKVVAKHGLCIQEAMDVDGSEIYKGPNSLGDIISYFNTTLDKSIFSNVSLNEEIDEYIMEALNRMLNMGFENKDNYIYDLLVKFNGDIPKALDWMNRTMINK